MNLGLLILAGLWAGQGAKVAERYLPASRASPSEEAAGFPWPELLGWGGGIAALVALEFLGIVGKARAAEGFSRSDFSWTFVILIATAAAGFCCAAVYQLFKRT